MPRRPTEFDNVMGYLQGAAQEIRDSKPGDLETEQLRTSIYHHVAEAIEIIATYAYTNEPSPSPHQPSGGGGRGGGHRVKQTTGGPKTWTFAADLDLLK